MQRLILLSMITLRFKVMTNRTKGRFLDGFAGGTKPPIGVFKMNIDAGLNQKDETR